MAKRRHRPPLRDLHAAVALGPLRQPIPPEFRAPAQSARDRCKPLLESAPQTAFGTEMIDQDDLAARTRHARELVEGPFRIRHRGDDVLRHDHIEERVGEAEMAGIHDRERGDMGELVLGHARKRLAQHRLGIVDSDDAVAARIIRQRDAGADADVEDGPAHALGGGDRGLAAGVEHGAEDEVVDRGPTRISGRDGVDVDLACHCPAP